MVERYTDKIAEFKKKVIDKEEQKAKIVPFPEKPGKKNKPTQDDDDPGPKAA